MLRKIAILIASSLSLFAMHSAEININEQDLEFGLNLDMGQYNRGIEPDTTFLGVKYLKAASKNSNDEYGKNVNTKYFAELNFMIKQEVSHSGLYVGLGVKTNFSAISNATFMSVPIGLDLSYVLPFKKFIPVSISGAAYYAPQSLSFADAASFVEYRAMIRAEVIERGSIFIGYRDLNTNYKSNTSIYNVTYNSSGYFGFKFEF